MFGLSLFLLVLSGVRAACCCCLCCGGRAAAAVYEPACCNDDMAVLCAETLCLAWLLRLLWPTPR
jgi:hypothetical protein